MRTHINCVDRVNANSIQSSTVVRRTFFQGVCMMPKSATCGTSFNVRVWCNTDPCGLICALISWLLVLYAESIVVVSNVFISHHTT